MVKLLRLRSIPGWAAAALLALSGCRVFEFSPYEAQVDKQIRGLNDKNLARIARADSGLTGEFSFAVIADIQLEFDALEAGIRHLNADPAIRFVVVAGDLTQYGLRWEYLWIEEALADLAAPYVAVMGNHDAQAQGVRIFRDLYGPPDFAFGFGDVRFLVFNTNVWEFTCCVPDYPWLEREAEKARGSRLVTVAHVPPFGDQFDSAGGRQLADFMVRHQVELAIFGHQHNYHLEEHYHDGIRYLVADDMSGRNYARITVKDSGITVERIFF